MNTPLQNEVKTIINAVMTNRNYKYIVDTKYYRRFIHIAELEIDFSIGIYIYVAHDHLIIKGNILCINDSFDNTEISHKTTIYGTLTSNYVFLDDYTIIYNFADHHHISDIIVNCISQLEINAFEVLGTKFPELLLNELVLIK
jgi:hypothetical protein